MHQKNKHVRKDSAALLVSFMLSLVLIMTTVLMFIGCSNAAGSGGYDHVIHFDCRGGTEIAGLIINDNTAIFQPGDPKKAGAKFLGWYSDSSLSTPYDFYEPVTSNLTLYAKWSTNSTSGNIGSGGSGGGGSGGSGSGGAGGGGSGSGGSGSVGDSTNPGEIGSGSVGDSTNPGEIGSGSVGEGTSRDVYVVSFNCNGGTAIEPRTVHKGDALNIAETEIPLRTKFEFEGWFTDNYTFVNRYNFLTPVTANITLCAKWSETTYTVTFVDDHHPDSTQIVYEGSTVAKPNDPVKPLHVFSGWYTDNGSFKNAYNFAAPVTGSLTLYAKWEKKQSVTTDEVDDAFGDIYNKYRPELDFSGATSYVVKSGDSLSKITQLSEVWGDLTNVGDAGSRNWYYFPLIMLASPDAGIVNPDKILPGMVLTIIDLKKNLANPTARAAIKNFLREIAAVYSWKDGPLIAGNLIALSNSL